MLALSVSATLACVAWSSVQSWAAQEVNQMGGTSSGSLSEDIHALRNLAWPRQQSADAARISRCQAVFKLTADGGLLVEARGAIRLGIQAGGSWACSGCRGAYSAFSVAGLSRGALAAMPCVMCRPCAWA